MGILFHQRMFYTVTYLCILKVKCHLHCLSIGNSGGQEARKGGPGRKGEKVDGKICCSSKGGNSASSREEGDMFIVYLIGQVILHRIREYS